MQRPGMRSLLVFQATTEAAIVQAVDTASKIWRASKKRGTGAARSSMAADEMMRQACTAIVRKNEKMFQVMVAHARRGGAGKSIVASEAEAHPNRSVTSHADQRPAFAEDSMSSHTGEKPVFAGRAGADNDEMVEHASVETAPASTSKSAATLGRSGSGRGGGSENLSESGEAQRIWRGGACAVETRHERPCEAASDERDGPWRAMW